MFTLGSCAANEQLAAFTEACKGGKSLLVEELWDTPKAILASLAQEATGKHIVIVTGGVRESRLFDDFTYFGKEAHEFPAWETLPSEKIPPSPDVVGERLEILRKINGGPMILLCPVQALLQRVTPPKRLHEGCWTLNVGDEVPFDQLIEILEAGGFQRRPVASEKGEYAIRGGIIDLFPVGSSDPYRVEFWGDTIEAIRIYDPVGQKSVDKAKTITFTPALELEQTASLFDYLGKETILIFDDLLAIEDRYVSLEELPGAISSSFVRFSDFLEETSGLQRLYWPAQTIDELGEVTALESGYYSKGLMAISFPAFATEFEGLRWKNPFQEVAHVLTEGEELLDSLGEAQDLGLKIEFLCEKGSDEEHLKEMIAARSIVLPEDTTFERGYLSSGFVLDHLALIPMSEITHRYRVRRQKQRSTYHTPPSEYAALKGGDLVVHFHHGIGKYLGVERRPNHEGREVEFMVLEYAEKGKLFVPMTQGHLVSKYIGSHEERPTLHQIGSNKWARTRATAERAIADYASDLLKMHAQRQMAKGHIYPADSDDLLRFERDFPYEETGDQLAAIAAVKEDLCSEKPMDRLICGDVGYGKTEVAMRAAFKVAHDGGKQVAILVPTTVLAMQHYETFSARMENYPINVGVLSRFRSAKEQKETLAQVKAGTVDILIGTHRIIGKDVHFKDLGLIIIDEEQKFGVRAKEKLRAFKAGVDSLTMTATPIPRTLYLSLMGARDLSVINTPPSDRLPIKTVICEENEEQIKAALLRELARDGQAYVIHNRVETIYDYADRLRKLLPHARIVVGHGQMGAEAMDEVFHTFKQGRADILVATTIVENGIDIPNANTIIVDRADRYGLSDLYQLRGRVGRWSRRAYAYLVTPRQRMVREMAEKRLKALLDIGGYGGGMRLAMRDLELRGAGNILGTQQSGYVSSVGFHLYCRMLKRTVKAMQGQGPHSMCETKMEFPQDARIPDEYIDEPTLRMEVYQRFGEATSHREVDAIFEELIDRFGKAPEPLVWLYHLMRIRVVAAAGRITALKMKKYTLQIERKEGTSRTILTPTKDPKEFEKQVTALLQACLDHASRP